MRLTMQLDLPDYGELKWSRSLAIIIWGCPQSPYQSFTAHRWLLSLQLSGKTFGMHYPGRLLSRTNTKAKQAIRKQLRLTQPLGFAVRRQPDTPTDAVGKCLICNSFCSLVIKVHVHASVLECVTLATRVGVPRPWSPVFVSGWMISLRWIVLCVDITQLQNMADCSRTWSMHSLRKSLES